MKTGKFGIPGKKAFFKGFGRPEVVVMDVTETEERTSPEKTEEILFRKEKTPQSKNAGGH